MFRIAFLILAALASSTSSATVFPIMQQPTMLPPAGLSSFHANDLLDTTVSTSGESGYISFGDGTSFSW